MRHAPGTGRSTAGHVDEPRLPDLVPSADALVACAQPGRLSARSVLERVPGSG